MDMYTVSRMEALRELTYAIWGTGRVAMKFYEKYVKERGAIPKPLFFCDNAPDRQGTEIDGIRVISPEEFFSFSDQKFRAAEQFGIVIGATSINLLQIVSQFEMRGVKSQFFSAPQLDAEIYYREHEAEVAEVASFMADEKSRADYLRIIDHMKTGRCLDFTLYQPNQYFGNDVIENLADDTIFVDAGVCDGEEIDKALSMNPRIEIHAFEPDVASFTKLAERYRENSQVKLYQKALGNEQGRVHFAANTAMPLASRIEMKTAVCIGGIEVVKLDDYVPQANFIKMDIEGAEFDALHGAEQVIRRSHPTLAICLYHFLEDYIRIPLLLHEYYEGYQFFFRHHSVTSGESVLYAIP